MAIWLDRCSRKIVGWDVRETIPEDLVIEDLRRPSVKLIIHFDQGR